MPQFPRAVKLFTADKSRTRAEAVLRPNDCGQVARQYRQYWLPLVMLEHRREQDNLPDARPDSLGRINPDSVAMSGELVTQRLQVVHLVPVELVQVEHEPGFLLLASDS